MKISNPQKLLLFALIILTANSIIGYIVFETYQKQLQSAKLVHQTEQTISLTTELFSLAHNIEISSRAFVMTRDSSFLQPMDKAERASGAYLQQLTTLAQDNPPALRQADSLRQALQKHIRFCRLRVTQSIGVPMVQTPDYPLRMIKDIQDKESILLGQRTRQHIGMVDRFNRFSVVMFILMTFFTVLLVAVTGNYLDRHKDKERWAGELIIANEELAHQDKEKEMRAAELIIANQELAFQNNEKEKRAEELVIANQELAFQNYEKQKRAEELVVANQELAFQNDEKEKRAAELIIANQELAFQNDEKEKRASELLLANRELEAFAYISSHDLQEPLRKIQTFSMRILDTEFNNLSANGKDYFGRMQSTASRMRQLIDDLLGFSRLNVAERKFENTDLNKIIEEVSYGLKETIDEKRAVVETSALGNANIIPFQFRQLMHNLLSNAIKFSNPRLTPHIMIVRDLIEGEDKNAGIQYHRISVSDNGIGFDLQYTDRIFEVFQKLHGKHEYPGTGIGLAIVKKIVENHNGHITVTSKLGHGTTFNIFIPLSQIEDLSIFQTEAYFA